MSELVTLTPRLQAVADLVRQNTFFADIGTDHGYLPVYLVKTGRVTNAVAADVNEKPLNQARTAIRKYGLVDRISLVLSNGLENVSSDVSDIAIAGMGGELIAQIISGVDWVKHPDKRLLLQPMTQDAFLRRFLADSGYMVAEEMIAEEKGRLYVVIQAAYSGALQSLSEAEAFIGQSLYRKDALSLKYIARKKEKLKKMITGLQQSEYPEAAEPYMRLLAEIERAITTRKEKNHDGI